MNNKVKFRVLNLVSTFIPFAILRFWMPRKFVLCGHLISDFPHPAGKLYKYPTFAEFTEAVDWLRSLGYEFVNLEGYMREDQMKKILLTFDDGFNVIHAEMHSFLKKQHIPYVIFIMTEALLNPEFTMDQEPGSSNFVDFKGYFLLEHEILQLKEDGVHIGFHGRNHDRIEPSKRGEEAILQQISIPREYQHLFSSPLCFAYSYAAPRDYHWLDQYMTEQLGVEYIFDTKGFIAPTGPHFFRVSLETQTNFSNKLWIKFVLKKKLILSLFNQLF